MHNLIIVTKKLEKKEYWKTKTIKNIKKFSAIKYVLLIFLIDVKEIIFKECFKNRLFLASICGSIVQLVGYETNLFCGNRQIAPRNGIHKNSLPRIITTEIYYLFT